MKFDKRLQSIFNCEFCEKKPCLIGCPLDNDIPNFIKEIKNDNIQEAFSVLSNTTFLMPICGRICPHYRQCEGSCIKKHTNNKVKIGKLEAFVGDTALKEKWKVNVQENTKYKVAVIGSGPAGLTCAAFLRKNGINVTIYEKYDYLGGLLVHGIPDFRLSKKLVSEVTKQITETGIEVIYNKELGRNLKLEDLKREYDAIFIGIGANVSNKMHIKGENLDGVFGGNELLEKKLDVNFLDKNVVVSGGGDVAMDVARTIKRLGAKKVTIIYRRSEKLMTADIKEIYSAKREGIEFICDTNILRINGDNKVESIDIINTQTIIDINGVKTIQNIKGTEKILPCDYVIRAIGSHPIRFVKKLDLQLNNQGKILIDKDGRTSDEKLFSGGDVAGTKSTVAWAARSGRNAAYAIIDYLSEKFEKQK